MPGPPDELDELVFDRTLTTTRFGRAHVHLRSCVSTNDELGKWARGAAGDASTAAAATAHGSRGSGENPGGGRAPAPEGAVVSSDSQSAGRGRLGRSWHSPAGRDLTFSLLLRPAGPTANIPPLTLLTGAAVARAVATLPVEVRLKWPNDVLLRPRADATKTAATAAAATATAAAAATTTVPFRKVAGILTEAATEGERVAHVVVGIGLNVNTDSFPDDLVGKATSLALATGVFHARAPLLARLLAELENAYDAYRGGGVRMAIERWQEHADLGRRCRAQGERGPVEGITVGVGESGELLIRDGRGDVHRVFSGEVVPLE